MDRITANPDQCAGRPCVRGMRIRVIDVLDLLAAGLSAWMRATFGVEAMPLRELGLRDAEDSAIFAAARAAGEPLVEIGGRAA
jgi:hypothetical protein